MNEQTKRLLEQSGLQPYYDAQEGHIEKFAELLIQEFMLKINGAKIRNESYAELIERIKEDFGVKE